MLSGDAGLCSDSAIATKWSPVLVYWLQMAGAARNRWSPLDTNYSSFPTQIRFPACPLRRPQFVFVEKVPKLGGSVLVFEYGIAATRSASIRGVNLL